MWNLCLCTMSNSCRKYWNHVLENGNMNVESVAVYLRGLHWSVFTRIPIMTLGKVVRYRTFRATSRHSFITIAWWCRIIISYFWVYSVFKLEARLAYRRNQWTSIPNFRFISGIGLWRLTPLSTIIQLVLLVEETGVPVENHRPAASHWQTPGYNGNGSWLL